MGKSAPLRRKRTGFNSMALRENIMRSFSMREKSLACAKLLPLVCFISDFMGFSYFSWHLPAQEQPPHPPQPLHPPPQGFFFLSRRMAQNARARSAATTRPARMLARLSEINCNIVPPPLFHAQPALGKQLCFKLHVHPKVSGFPVGPKQQPAERCKAQQGSNSTHTECTRGEPKSKLVYN